MLLLFAAGGCTRDEAAESPRRADGPGADAHEELAARTQAANGAMQPGGGASGGAQRESFAAISGATLYAEQCATCHMPDGAGVPFLQPALIDAPTVTDTDPDTLIKLILHGPESLPAEEYTPFEHGNAMAAYAGQLNDAETAALVNWLRREFGNAEAPGVEPATVAELRNQG